MADLAPFPDVEAVLVQALAEFATTGTVTPADLVDRLPFVRVRRLGGADDRRTDIARIDVEVYAATRKRAWQLAEQIRQRLISGPVNVPLAGRLDHCRTEVGPQDVPHESQDLRRVLTTFRICARR